MASAGTAPNCDVTVRVVDVTGAAIPRALVKLSKSAGAETVGGASDDRGEFSGSVAPGVYSLAVEAPGFSTLRQEFACKTSEAVSVDVQLQIGVLLGEVVEVKPGHASLWEMFRSLFRRH